MFKKEDELNKENYRSASVLYHTSKIFERIVLHQMNIFFKSRFSLLLPGSVKYHSTQNALLCVTEKWKHLLIKAERLVRYL